MEITSADFIKTVVDAEQLPQDKRPQVAFFGRSNVGKSSLINSLVKKKGLSRTSNTPGRTQAMNLFLLNGSFYLVDLPGYGFAKASKDRKEAFQQLIIDYVNAEQPLVLAIVIIDARHEPTKLDLAMLESLGGRDIPFAIIANKIDKLSRSEMHDTLRKLHAQFPNADVIAHSTEAKVGRGEILGAIEKAIRKAA